MACLNNTDLDQTRKSDIFIAVQQHFGSKEIDTDLYKNHMKHIYLKSCKSISVSLDQKCCCKATVELQWLEHLWDHAN